MIQSEIDQRVDHVGDRIEKAVHDDAAVVFGVEHVVDHVVDEHVQKEDHRHRADLHEDSLLLTPTPLGRLLSTGERLVAFTAETLL